MDKWDYTKLKSSAQQKKQLTKWKEFYRMEQTTEWEKIFENHISDMGLISKIHKELSQLNNKKPNNLIKNQQSKPTFLQRGRRNSQQTDEKMPNITKHQGNANQNEVLPHTC